MPCVTIEHLRSAPAFVLLGFAALLFLTTQLPASGLKIGTAKKGFAVSAEFDNVGI